MRVFLERLMVAATAMATPLLAVAATTKKPARKATRSKAKPARPPRGNKTPARPKPGAQVKPGLAKGVATKTTATAAKTAGSAKTARRGAAVHPKAPETVKSPARRPEPTTPQPKPVAPTARAFLLLPENGKYSDSVTPRFRWLSVGGATRYEVQWSEHVDLTDAHTVVSVATEAAVPAEKPLRVGAAYFWRVRGGNDGGWGPWSPPSTFQVLEEPPPS